MNFKKNSFYVVPAALRICILTKYLMLYDDSMLATRVFSSFTHVQCSLLLL